MRRGRRLRRCQAGEEIERKGSINVNPLETLGERSAPSAAFVRFGVFVFGSGHPVRVLDGQSAWRITLVVVLVAGTQAHAGSAQQVREHGRVRLRVRSQGHGRERHRSRVPEAHPVPGHAVLLHPHLATSSASSRAARRPTGTISVTWALAAHLVRVLQLLRHQGPRRPAATSSPSPRPACRRSHGAGHLVLRVHLASCCAC